MMALEADRNKGGNECITGLSCSISPRDTCLVTAVLGQQTAKCEQRGKSSGIPRKCHSNVGMMVGPDDIRNLFQPF